MIISIFYLFFLFLKYNPYKQIQYLRDLRSRKMQKGKLIGNYIEIGKESLPFQVKLEFKF